MAPLIKPAQAGWVSGGHAGMGVRVAGGGVIENRLGEGATANSRSWLLFSVITNGCERRELEFSGWATRVS